MEATVHLLEPEDERRKLAHLRDCPTSLVPRRAPYAGQTEVILVEGVGEGRDCEGQGSTYEGRFE